MKASGGGAPWEGAGATVGIVGLGMIGGSIARDVSTLGARVVAVEPEPDNVRRGLDAAAIVDGGPEPERLAEADMIVVAVPPSAAAAVLEGVAAHAGGARWITDACGTKRSVVRAAAAAGLGPRFIGSHPLAGATGSGFAASRAGLFRRARVYLCAGETTAPETVADVGAFWAALGATPMRIDAAEHDRLLAWTSQLPQMAATALGVALDRAGIAPSALGPGGRDTTRLAASSPELWADIAADSGPLLLEALDAYAGALDELRRALRGGPEGAVRRLLADGRDWSGR